MARSPGLRTGVGRPDFRPRRRAERGRRRRRRHPGTASRHRRSPTPGAAFPARYRRPGAANPRAAAHRRRRQNRSGHPSRRRRRDRRGPAPNAESSWHRRRMDPAVVLPEGSHARRPRVDRDPVGMRVEPSDRGPAPGDETEPLGPRTPSRCGRPGRANDVDPGAATRADRQRERRSSPDPRPGNPGTAETRRGPRPRPPHPKQRSAEGPPRR